MSDGALSQDEINALLSNNDSDLASSSANTPNKAIFTAENMTTLTSIFAPFSAVIENTIKSMIDSPVKVKLLEVKESSKESFLGEVSDKIIDVALTITGDAHGNRYYIMDALTAIPLGEEITGQSHNDDNGDAGINSAFSELFGQISQATTTHLNDVSGLNLQCGVSNSQVIDKQLSRIPSSGLVVITYDITYSDKSLTIYELLDASLAKSLLVKNQKEAEAALSAATTINAASASETQIHQGVEYTSLSTSQHATPSVQGVSLPNLTSGSMPQETKNIGLLMDVMMEVTVELGRTRQPIKDILSIGEGTIIELDKLAGETVDILVNHNLIAKGEGVVIDENFGVRITEIVSGSEKLAGQ
jgi:flagellar motor switch protein FliN/FliY